MKIRFLRDVRFDLVNNAGHERLVDYYCGTIVDNVNVVDSVVNFGNGDTAFVGSDNFEILPEIPLTNTENVV